MPQKTVSVPCPKCKAAVQAVAHWTKPVNLSHLQPPTYTAQATVKGTCPQCKTVILTTRSVTERS